MSNHLIDRERVSIVAEIIKLSERFNNGDKREVVFEASIVLDDSEVSDDMLGQKFTITVTKERKP